MRSIIISSFVCLFICLGMQPATAQNSNAPNTDENGISYKPNYRTKSVGNKQIRAGRKILDEMTANTGVDNTLRDFGWDNLELKAAFAAHWIKKQDEAKFQELYRDIDNSSKMLEKSADEIDTLRKELISKAGLEKDTFDKLVAVTPSEKVRLLRSVFGFKNPASALTTLRKGLLDWVDYVDAKLMSDDMLERLELIAYLGVLLRKYDHVLNAHDDIKRRLIKAHSEAICN